MARRCPRARTAGRPGRRRRVATRPPAGAVRGSGAAGGVAVGGTARAECTARAQSVAVRPRAPRPGRRGCARRPRPSPRTPRSRAAAAVTGPMTTTTGGQRVGPGGRDEVGHRRRRGEGDGVGRPRPLACRAVELHRHRPVGVDHVDLPAARHAARRAAPSRATSARASSTRPPPSGGSGNAASSPSATNRSGTRSTRRWCSASTPAVPGPIAASRTPARSRASCSSASARRAPLGEVRTSQSYRPGAAIAERSAAPPSSGVGDPDRGHLDDLGAEHGAAGRPARRPGRASG